MAAPFRGSVSFTVPAGAGSYAPERIQFAAGSLNVAALSLTNLTALVTTAIASAVLELWLLKQGADPTNDSNYFLYKAVSGTGDNFPLSGVEGAQLRCKSGGTAGSQLVSAWALSGVGGRF